MEAKVQNYSKRNMEMVYCSTTKTKTPVYTSSFIHTHTCTHECASVLHQWLHISYQHMATSQLQWCLLQCLEPRYTTMEDIHPHTLLDIPSSLYINLYINLYSKEELEVSSIFQESCIAHQPVFKTLKLVPKAHSACQPEHNVSKESVCVCGASLEVIV